MPAGSALLPCMYTADELEAAQRIVARQADRAVVHYELEAGEGFAYEPGDALGVWPLNPPPVVARVAAHLPGAALDAPVQRADAALYRGKVAGRNRVVDETQTDEACQPDTAPA